MFFKIFSDIEDGRINIKSVKEKPKKKRKK